MYTEHFDSYEQATSRMQEITLNPQKYAIVQYVEGGYTITWGYYKK